MVPRGASPRYQHIAQLQIEQKSYGSSENPKPQPSYTLSLQEGLLWIDRHCLFALLRGVIAR
jgi:hypothetical protein